MTKVSNELIASMRHYIPTSIVKHQIRLFAAGNGPAPETLPAILANLPRQIVRAHVPCTYASVLLESTIEAKIKALSSPPPDRSDRSTAYLDQRQGYIEVCELVQDQALGFRFPSWRTAKFAKELRSDWLIEDGKALYEYCLANDLRPGFSRFYTTSGRSACKLIIRWQGAHFDRLLKLKEHPLFAHMWQTTWQAPAPVGDRVDIPDLLRRRENALQMQQQIEEECRAQFERDMDEECAIVSSPLIAPALAAIERAAEESKTSATIWQASDQVNAFGCFGGKLSGTSSGTHYSDHRLFDRPTCFGGVVARGLCLWAQKENLKVDIQISQWNWTYPRDLKLVVSW